MRLIILMLAASACFGQGKQNVVWSGVVDASNATLKRTGAIVFPIGDPSASTTPATGVSYCGESPYAATITGWRARSLNGTSGSIAVGVTVNGSSIVTSSGPAITSGTAATGAGVWTSTAIAQGDLICFSVTSVTAITYGSVTLLVTKQ